jgi:hypothetical protein
LVDQAAIIDALVRAVKASEDPRGALWSPLARAVMQELSVTVDEVNNSILAGIDDGVIVDEQMGWLKLPTSSTAHPGGVPAPQ